MEFIERLKADLITLGGALRALRYTTHIAKNPTRVFPQLIEELAEKYGDAPALLSDRESLSYRELGARSNRYARWALAQGIAQGRHGLPADAEPAGVPGDLARHHPRRRRGRAAQHQPDRARRSPTASTWSRPGTSSSTPSCSTPFAIARSRTSRANAKIWLHGDAGANLPRIDREIDGFSGDALADGERRALTIEDRALFIYTSGTTGLPKAANINHYRLMLATHAFAGVMNTRAERPHVRLPAALPHRRRRCWRPARCCSTAARW